MQYIYIGSICTDDTIAKLKKLNSHIDYPGVTFQRALLKGLDYYYPELNVISTPLISSYPRVKKVCIHGEEFLRNDESKGESLYTGIINLPVIKMFSKYFRVRKLIKNLLKTDKDATVIIYALHSPFLLAAASLRPRLKRICVVVPDLPEYMNSKIGRLARVGKALDKKIIDHCLKKFDNFVLLSPYMRERLPIENKCWIQVEGIYESGMADIAVAKDKYKAILYTGSLSYKYGIKELLAAFSKIENTNYRLWIRGNGEALDDVKELAKTDPRVVYFDRMSKEDLTKLQKSATLLINPTFASVESTKYFFPSKTMEYLASGTPVLMSELPCLPKEYKQYLYILKEESVDGLKYAIESILSKPQVELDQKGEEGKRFILEQKNSYMQAKKIVDMLAEQS